MKLLSATVKLEHDPETGDLFLPLPDKWLDTLDWRVGDKVKWRKHANGGWYLTNRTWATRDKLADQVGLIDANSDTTNGGGGHETPN